MTCAGTAWAFEQNTKDATAKLVLIAISDGACGDDETYMIDRRHIASVAMIDLAQVDQQLGKLQDMGLISPISSENEILYRLNGAQS